MEFDRHNHPDDSSELLSAYVDGAADIAERKRAEALIERCPACARELGELRALKHMLRELPSVQPARSFTLDPATAPHPRRLLFPTLRLATLLSAVLLFVVLGVDTLGGASGGQSTESATSAMMASTAADTQARELSAAEESQPGFALSRASAAAQTAEQAGGAAGAAPADQAAASAEASVETEAAEASAAVEAYVEASAEAAAAAGSEAAASEAPGNAPAAVAPQDSAAAGSEPTEQANAQASAVPSTAASMAPAAAYEAPAAELVAPGTDGYVPPAGGESADPERLDSAETTSPDTVTAAGEPAGSSSFDTLRIAEILLALAAVALGIGAYWAWRTGR